MKQFVNSPMSSQALTLPSPLKDALPLTEVRRVLVVKLRHHGDVLLSSPLFSVLKAHAPHCEIDALVYADTAEMLTGHPAIHQIHVIGRDWKKHSPLARLSAEWQVFCALRQRHYDMVIHLTEHWRGVWLVRLLQPRWAVAFRQGKYGKRWARHFTHLVEHPKNALRHVLEVHLDVLRRIGIQPTPEERRLCLVPGAVAEATITQKLRTLGLSDQGFIHIHPASRWLFKCWPPEKMSALITALQDKGWPVVLTAAPSADELAMVAAIQDGLEQPVISLAGELSLKELAALTAKARLFIGVDSAPMHMAAALSTPVLALFGPSGDQQWGAWSSGAPVRLISSSAHPCRPCGIDGCGGGKVSDCLSQISSDTVLAAAEVLLGK